MGRARRRHTAKTGDKALYQKRNQQATAKEQQAKDDDPMYDKVDQFHNQQDLIRLEKTQDDNASSSEDDEFYQQQAVMDLGIGGGQGDSSSSEDDDDDNDGESSDEDEQDNRAKKAKALDFDKEEEEEEQIELSDDDDDDDDDSDDENNMPNIRDWGRSKKDYYHGDTADLEIGQEEEDAMVEEQAAKEIQAARYQQMKEDDFVLSDDEADNDDDKEQPPALDNLKAKKATQHWDKLAPAEKSKFLDRQHPELLPLVSHFTSVLQDWKQTTNVVTRALLEGEEGNAKAVGATKLGQEYLLTKAMLQSCAGLNLAAYLLLKSEQASTDDDDDTTSPATLDSAWMQTHPVLKDLHKINGLLHKLQDQVEQKVTSSNNDNNSLEQQMDKLVQASALLAHGQVKIEKEEEEDDDDHNAIDENDSEDGNDKEMDETEKDKARLARDKDAAPSQNSGSDNSSSSDEEQSDDDSDEDKEHIRARNIANEARFGLRAAEVATAATNKIQKRRPAPSDFGEARDNDQEDVQAGISLAATLNSIEQRSASRKRKNAPMADAIDEANENDELRRGLAMMEDDLGPASDDDGGAKSNHEDQDNEGNTFDPEAEEDDFYTQMTKKSKSKKEFKKNLYAVKPKYPRLEQEIEGERAVSKTIMKNRGLVAHKNKLNRNPRVKKREQYRKALIRRKGAVREVRTDEGHKYGGETTGIKSNISRSRRLAG